MTSDAWHNGKVEWVARRRHRISRRKFLGTAAILLTAPVARAGARSLVPPPRPLHAPRPSDVCFSIRQNKHGALDVAKSFSATRLDWSYTVDSGFLTRARDAGLAPLGGALNTILPDQVNGKTWREGRIRDAQGQPVTAPWMRWPGVAAGCVNSPAYRRSWLDHARASLKAGIDWFMVDDPRMNEVAVGWGGCYCGDCQAEAVRQGVDLNRDMVAFQRDSVTRFHRDMRQAVDEMAGRHVTFACNNFGGQTGWPYDFFDFGIAEVDPIQVKPPAIARLLRDAEAAGRPQVLTLRSVDVALNQRLIAWCYANGGHLLAPWDVYLRSTVDGSDRYFGNADDYAPLFAFAQRMDYLLDRAVVQTVPPPGSMNLGDPGWQTSLRITPDGRRAALHLVAWETAESSVLTLDLEGILPGATHSHLRGPNGYSQELHDLGGRLAGAQLPPLSWVIVEIG